MEPYLTPKPMPVSASKLPLDHTNKLLGIVYITPVRVIDTIIPASGLWSWSLPTNHMARLIPGNVGLAAQGWFPDSPDHLLDSSAKLPVRTEVSIVITEINQSINYQISYNIQEALTELPHDLSNNIEYPTTSIKIQAMPPN
ncbi:hypothetical protein DSO57_1032685 [Entomophthora muscae]|uniref:Uncharacterized protein n=1 Tax=Entomophthora muscae TaxID=34485 RepID=A0ACC2T0E8_9FUNG|nr:hypothetical protein DSO57_1032685 [Entomophthora muscae]